MSYEIGRHYRVRRKGLGECTGCGREIRIGEKYLVYCWVEDGMLTVYACAECEAVFDSPDWHSSDTFLPGDLGEMHESPIDNGCWCSPCKQARGEPRFFGGVQQRPLGRPDEGGAS